MQLGEQDAPFSKMNFVKQQETETCYTDSNREDRMCMAQWGWVGLA